MGVIVAFLFGGFCGIALMCLVQVNKENDNINLRVKLEDLVKKWKQIKEAKKKEYETTEYKNEEERLLNQNVAIIAELVSEELENIL